MNQIAPRETSINSVTVASGANGSSIAPQNLGEVVRFAEVMCKADIALPKHLRGNAGACMAVAMQALEWQMSPFAVASKSYSVNGTIAYEAQLIAAVVNTRSGIKGRLKYAFNGSGNDMTCTVTGTLNGEECEYTSPTIGTIPTKNSPLWKSDPQQQLGYFSARSWARRHCPEVLLGVYDRDEAESFQGPDNAKDVTPVPSVMQRLQQRQSEPQSGEGFSKDFVTSETETLASGSNNEEQDTPADVASSGSVEGGERSVLSGSTLINSDEEQAELTGNQHDDSEVVPDYEQRRECLDKFMAITKDNSISIQQRRGTLEQAKDYWKADLPHDLDFVRFAFNEADRVIKGERTEEEARENLSSFIEVA